ncbi:MAG: hypothetical protein RR967_07060 [Anaerovoracaceae bacterium]
MFIDVIKQVKISEQDADQIKVNGINQKKMLIDNAKTEAENLLVEADKLARSKYDEILDSGQQEAEEQYKKHMEYVDDMCKMIEEKAHRNQAETVAFIAERIVKDSVNS